MRASRGVAWTLRSVANGRPVGICDERSREREQTDCEHDERAVQMSDLAHRSLLPVFVGAPVTLGPTPNRTVTNG